MTTNNDIVVLRSQDRSLALGSQQTTNFKIQLPAKFNNVVQLSLLSASIPNNFYQINSDNGFNSGLYFIGPNNGVQTAVVFLLSDGNYTVDDICTSLLTFLQKYFLNSTSPIVTSVDYDFVTNKFSWTSSLPMGVFNTISSSHNQLYKIMGLDVALDGTPYFGGLPSTPYMSKVLGSIAGNNYVINSDGTYTNTFLYPANIHQVNEILLKLGNVRPNVYTSSNIQATFRVPVNPDGNNIISINTATNISNVINMSPCTLEYFDVTLLDLDNNIINLHNTDWSFSLGIKSLI